MTKVGVASGLTGGALGAGLYALKKKANQKKDLQDKKKSFSTKKTKKEKNTAATIATRAMIAAALASGATKLYQHITN